MDIRTAVELSAVSIGFVGALFTHELGHLIVARWCGVRVISISIGLGPEILGWTDWAGTRWKVAAVPLGGSCTFLHRSNDRSSCSKISGYITRKSARQKMVIFAAGPIASFLLAAIVVAICLSIHIPDWSVGDIIQSRTAPGLFVAALSLTVGVFNLLPILPLDGGHLVLSGIELARGRPLPPTIEQWLHLGGRWVVLILSIVAVAGLSLVF